MTNSADHRSAVSLHPAFPAIVALWFAALLGLGSMVMPVALLESFVTTTGLSAIIPGAQPPLGFTARGLLALVAAGSGAIAGLVLARKVAGSQRAKGGNRLSRITGGSSAATPRPISAHEELGGEGLLAGGSRRRSLSVTDEARPSDFLANAPLPGSGDHSPHQPAFSHDQPLPETNVEQTALFVASDADAFDLLDLGDALVPDEDFGDEPVTVHGYAAAAAAFADDASEGVEMDQEHDVQPASIFRSAFPADRVAAEDAAHDVPTSAATVDDNTADAVAWPAEPVSDAMGLPNLVEQLGRSMVRRRQAIASAAAASAHKPKPELKTELTTPVAPDVASAPAADFADPDLQVARPEEAAQAMAAYFGKPAAIGTPRETAAPAAFDLPREDAPVPELARSFTPFLSVADDDGEELDDFTASFSLPLQPLSQFSPQIELTIDPLAMVAEADEMDAVDEDDTAEADEPFSSLLSLNNPFIARSHGFVRVAEVEEDEDPVAGHVVFPGQDVDIRPIAMQAAADAPAQRLFDRPGTAPVVSRNASGEMDDALRSALAKLQRMSGAA